MSYSRSLIVKGKSSTSETARNAPMSQKCRFEIFSARFGSIDGKILRHPKKNAELVGSKYKIRFSVMAVLVVF